MSCFFFQVYSMITETVRALIKLFREEIFDNVILSAGNIVEISKLPVLILNGPTLHEKKRLARDSERIVAIDLDESKAIYEVPPRWYDLHFDISISCKSNLELIELIEKLSRLNQKNKLITAKNKSRERQYTWEWHNMAGFATDPNISQVFQARGEIVIYDVEVYSGIQEVWPLIRKIKIDIEQDKIEVE